MDGTPNNLYSRIKNLMPSFNPSFSRIGKYFLENMDNLKFMRIKNIAEKCTVSESTVTRFIRAIGFSSFYNFKIAIVSYENPDNSEIKSSQEDYIFADIHENESLDSMAEKIKTDYINTIDITAKNIDFHEIKKAVDVISKARSINFYAVGNSSIAAKNAHLRFYRIGFFSNVYVDSAEMAATSSLLNPDDVAIGISYSGKSEPVLKAIQYCKERKVPTIAITGPNNSPLIRAADIKLTSAKAELDDFQISSYSRLSQILIMDLIYAGVAALNYKYSADAIKISAAKVRDILNN